MVSSYPYIYFCVVFITNEIDSHALSCSNVSNCSWHPKAITEGSSIKLMDCKDKRKQRFKFGGTAEPILSRDPNLCVSYATTESPEVGDKMKLHNCSGNASQDWSWA